MAGSGRRLAGSAGRHGRVRLCVCAVAALAAIACRDSPPAEEPPAVAPGVAPITFTNRTPLGFSYVDQAGTVRSARSIASVPVASRRVVRVIDPTAKASAEGDDELVHLVDLAQPNSSGKYKTTRTSRRSFLRRALAALPPGSASRVDLPSVRLATDRTPAWAHEQIVIYGTSWCGACKEARAYLRKRNLPFVDKNVERDAVAAAELAIKLDSVGVAPDRVPVIDVRGYLLVGFDPVRVRTLLGEQI